MPPAVLPDQLLQRADLWLGGQAAVQPAEASGFAALDALLPGGGWPRGALSELILEPGVHADLALALPALVRCTTAGRRVALVAPPQIPYAPALLRAGVDLRQLWVVDADQDSDTVWALEQLLRSAACALAMGWARRLDDRAQRRLQLAAEHGDAVALMVRPAEAAAQTSIAALRMRLRSGPGGTLEAELLKLRGGRSGSRLRLDRSA